MYGFWFSLFFLRLRRNVKKNVIIIVSFIIFVYGVFHFSSVSLVDDDSFWELAKCPACYGTLSCNYLKENLVLDHWSLWNLINVKNVYYGKILETKVVAKKLAHSIELSHFDEIICQLKNSESSSCSVGQVWRKFVYQHNFLVNNNSLNALRDVVSKLKIKTEAAAFESGIISCPSDRLLSIILKTYHTSESIANIAFSLLINPEPLLSQILTNRVPKLLGMCGRVIVEEYVGPTLANFYFSSWKIRLKLAASLLELADELTFHNSSGLAFYLTDVSFDNFAVGHDFDETSVRVKLIDAESVIVVDSAANPATLHVNDFENSFDSPELRFSREELCQVAQADHNYYAICKCILSDQPCSLGFFGGLLWGLPEEIENQFRISSLIKSCVKGDKNRIKTAHQLLRSIYKIVK